MREAGCGMLAPQPGATIREIGFRTGHALVWLARAVGPSGKVHGIDLSDGMLAVAENLFRQEGLPDRAELRAVDATDLPYPADSMDAVFMSFTLESFDTVEIPIALAACRRSQGWRADRDSRYGPHGLAYGAHEWTTGTFPAWA